MRIQFQIPGCCAFSMGFEAILLSFLFQEVTPQGVLFQGFDPEQFLHFRVQTLLSVQYVLYLVSTVITCWILYCFTSLQFVDALFRLWLLWRRNESCSGHGPRGEDPLQSINHGTCYKIVLTKALLSWPCSAARL